MNVPLYNAAGEETGQVDLPDAVFGVAWKPTLVHQVFLAQMANRREPVAHAKGRGEVSGGGKKPWRQKGTGRARHGSIRSPLWRGGGVTHGPSRERSYTQKVNRKARSLAVRSVLSKKLADGEVRLVESLATERAKTNELHRTLARLLGREKSRKQRSSIIVPCAAHRETVRRTSSNIPYTSQSDFSCLNVVDLLTYRYVVIERDALAT